MTFGRTIGAMSRQKIVWFFGLALYQSASACESPIFLTAPRMISRIARGTLFRLPFGLPAGFGLIPPRLRIDLLEIGVSSKGTEAACFGGERVPGSAAGFHDSLVVGQEPVGEIAL